MDDVHGSRTRQADAVTVVMGPDDFAALSEAARAGRSAEPDPTPFGSIGWLWGKLWPQSRAV